MDAKLKRINLPAPGVRSNLLSPSSVYVFALGAGGGISFN